MHRVTSDTATTDWHYVLQEKEKLLPKWGKENKTNINEIFMKFTELRVCVCSYKQEERKKINYILHISLVGQGKSKANTRSWIKREKVERENSQVRWLLYSMKKPSQVLG